MAGKPYTMREMKGIVEYLNDHKAYGELKGRKMWTDFASSDRTERTWQSLKETFLKRILPDIQNPYYKLTMDQVRSFREGVDVVEKKKNNKLEFQPADQQSNGTTNLSKPCSETQDGLQSTATKDKEVPKSSHEIEEDTQINNEPITTSIHDELEKVTGEDVKAAKIPSRSRSSADTVVLEYKNAEDVQRALESPRNEPEVKSKSLKDMLTFEYTAPLTPLVQELLDDFGTESSSDSEPRLKIAEDLPKTNNSESEAMLEDALACIKEDNVLSAKATTNNEADSTIVIDDTDQSDSTEINDKIIKTTVTKETSNEDPIPDTNDKPDKDENQKLNSHCDNNKHNNNNEENSHENNNQINQQEVDDEATKINHNSKDTTVFVTTESNAKTFDDSSKVDKNTTDSNNIIGNNTNLTESTPLDSLLPNNQEALYDSKKEIQNVKNDKTVEITDNPKSKQNRLKNKSSSKDNKKSKKQKLSNVKLKEIKNDEASTLELELLDSSSQKINLGKMCQNENTPIIETCDSSVTNNLEEQTNVSVKHTSENVNKTSKNTENDIPNNVDNQDINTTVVEDKNPCLQSVSLFEEQHRNTKYSDSDSDDEMTQKQSTDKSDNVTEKLKQDNEISQKRQDNNQAEVIIDKKKASVLVQNNKKTLINLDSSTDSEPRNQRKMTNTNVNIPEKQQREKALANVFGFAHGLAPTSRKRQLSHRRSQHRRQRFSKTIDSNSSEWTSESDSECYVSPPCSRKNRKTNKKYLKPKSSRIVQDPDEGMLYVIHGKKIYPLVKNGKHIKTFLTYRPDSGSDGDETFWKQRYIEEKKRVEEVRNLLKEEQKGNNAQINNDAQPSTSRNSTTTRSPQTEQKRNSNNHTTPPEEEKKSEVKDDKMVLKIAGNGGLEYSLEGGWDQISNAMPQVLRMMQSEPVVKKVVKLSHSTDNQLNVAQPSNSAGNQLNVAIPVEISSGVSTPVPPVDHEVHEKVNKLETEIFNEIMNLEAQETNKEVKQSDTDDTNITKRKRGRPPKSEALSSNVETKSPAKRTRRTKTNSTDSKQEETKTKRVTNSKLNIPQDNQDDKEKLDEIAEQKQLTPTKKVAEKQKDLDKKLPVRKPSSRISKQRDSSVQNSGLEDNASDGRTRVSSMQLRTSVSKQRDSSVNNSGLEDIAADGRTRVSGRQLRTSISKQRDSSVQNSGLEDNASDGRTRVSGRQLRTSISNQRDSSVQNSGLEDNASDGRTRVSGRQLRTSISKQRDSSVQNSGLEDNASDGRTRVSGRQLRTSISNQRDSSVQNSGLEDNASDGRTRVSGRQLRTPKKYDSSSSSRDVNLQSAANKKAPVLGKFDDENILYMLPPKSKKRSPVNKNKSLLEFNAILTRESGNSVDSTYGYQDSDPTPIKICMPKRKRKASFTTRNKYMNKRFNQRRSCPIEVPSGDSNNSSYFIPVRKSLMSLNSEVYSTDSYQLLMPKQKLSSKKLERIDENNSALAEMNPDIRHFNSISKDSYKSSGNSGYIVDVGSSSNVSLPPSPEISVVENMSITREMITKSNYPTINEVQQNVNNQPTNYNEYLIAELDISVPLMDQKCKLRKTTDGITSAQKLNKTDSIQLKDCSVNLTLSETLDRRLRNLLLESNKKPTRASNNKETPMEVDQTVVVAKKTVRQQNKSTAMDIDVPQPAKKKTKGRKRTSTPRKKKSTPKSKAPQDPIIEEEFVESCAAGRKSCPPVVTFIPIDENANHSSDVTFHPVRVNSKKKDVIKVKVLKPRVKSRSEERLRGKSVANGSIASTYTDSGINDTDTITLMLKDCSVELIHNHSETCLLANECIRSNSVEFVQNSPMSVVSLSSSKQSEDSAFFRGLQSGVVLSEDSTINQDNVATEARISGEIFESPKTRYHSPFASMSSLMTEDLSNSPPPQLTKWYLLDEDVTNTESASTFASVGSNLKQIFPIACAVPNLSIISEMSKENDDSRKASGDSQK